MSWANKTYTFSPSTTAKSAEVNQNFNDMVDGLDTAMPSGAVIIWSGSTATIPTGWYLCDGNNSTPDLRNRFVMGAGDTYAVNATGGAITHTLSEAEMPQHNHAVTDPGHYHITYTDNNGGTLITSQENESNGRGNANEVSYRTATKTTGITLGNKGSSDAHSILNPYYALAYMRKS